MQPSLSKELALDALLKAVWCRKPTGRVVVHSDQGSQYGSDDFKRFCQAHNLEPSMSRRANCWDNAVAESFFSSLKKERIRTRIYKTRDLARADIFDYIEGFYNRTRCHTHLGGVSPEAFESAAACSGAVQYQYPFAGVILIDHTRRDLLFGTNEKRDFKPFDGLTANAKLMHANFSAHDRTASSSNRRTKCKAE